jgi:hypothetical protein
MGWTTQIRLKGLDKLLFWSRIFRSIMLKKGDRMKDEYDFSRAERGKFFREGARLVPPVHLDPEVLDYLSERASAQGISLSSLVNMLLKKNIELIDAGK